MICFYCELIHLINEGEIMNYWYQLQQKRWSTDHLLNIV